MVDQVYDFGKAGGRDQSNWISFTVFEVGILISGIAGIGAAISAIMGLIGLSPAVLAAVAAISAGTAMLSEGGANAAGLSRQAGKAGAARPDLEIAGGFAFQALTGLAAIVMGIFSLLGFHSDTLLCVSALAMGAGLIAIGISLVRREPMRTHHDSRRDGLPGLISGRQSSGALELLVGIGAGVLGILGLAAGYPFTFSLIAMLAVGAAIFFNGTSLGARLFRSGD